MTRSERDADPAEIPAAVPEALPSAEESSLRRLWRFLVGRPRSLTDRSLFHRLALIPFLAWVGLGADGLSSSAYGPEEAFRQLGEHTYLAIALAAMMILTVLVISTAYGRIIEEFPHGGGGYLVATKLLGERTGVVSGSALLIDYVLTITVSIAAAGDALFSFVPLELHALKLPLEVGLLAGLTMLNLRGVRESVLILTPVFLLFLVTHVVLIGWGLGAHAPQLIEVARDTRSGFESGLLTLGAAGLFMRFIHAYSLGSGTYTGIEAVSNGLQMMREPRAKTARRTMVYMAVSLALTASGLILCYLLWDVSHEQGKTMNAVLAERVAGSWPGGHTFVVVTLVAEGLLLVVAAQAGFLDGPRVLANMAVDNWLPRRFAALSDRLTTQNGILLMGTASGLALFMTHGDVRHLVVMYSINVFVTFSLSMLGMTLVWSRRRGRPKFKRWTSLFVFGFLLCATILAFTVYEKFLEGGWITLAVTGTLVLVCYAIRAHYKQVSLALSKLHSELGNLEQNLPARSAPTPEPDPARPTAAVLVSAYGGLGIHTLLNIFRTFPEHFQSVVFLSIGVVDSGAFKGEEEVARLEQQTDETLRKFVALARGLGIPATSRKGLGTDAVEEAEKLCLGLVRQFPRTTFFAGQVIFQRERWFQRLLHNETAYAIQKRLQWAGQTMVILPARVR
ncbi:MAG: APC family permease, partial [Planctomycetota bacterium]